MKRWILRILKALGALIVLLGALFLFNYVRHYAIWAPTEAVEFASADGTVIRGTLIKPSDEGVHPAVALIHGAGPDNIYAFDYVAVANAFMRRGFTVLLYDKRGVGESDGDFRSAGYLDFVADAIAAVNHLASRPDIDGNNIGLHPISEGGWFAPEVAYRTGQVAFIAHKVSAPFSWIDTVTWEVRNDLLAAGVDAAGIDPLLDVAQRRWQYYIDTGANPELATGERREALAGDMKQLSERYPASRSVLDDELVPYDAASYARYAGNFGYDPGPYLQSIDIPLYYAYGETDINIPTSRSVEFLDQFRKDYGNDIEVVVYDGLGHGLVTPRGLFHAGYAPGYLDRITSWSADQIVR